MKRAANIVTLIVVLMTSTDVFADGFRQSDWGGHMWGGGMILGPLMMIGFFVLIVLLVVTIIRWISGSGQSAQIHISKSALEFLNERYAKGEIDKAEYEERKSVILS
jgi:putative membrane protein